MRVRKLNANVLMVDGVEVTSTPAELNALDGITASVTELNYVDITAAGAVQASKACVVDANLDLGDFRNLDCTNLDAGKSGTAGTVDVFASTANKGKLIISCDDQDGNTTVTLKAAAMAQNAVIAIPDTGAATGEVLLTSANNDRVMVAATSAEINASCDQSAQNAITVGANFSGTGTLYHPVVEPLGPNMVKTTIFIDLTGTKSKDTDLDIIGNTGAGAHIGQILTSVNGTIVRGQMTCCEVPTTGADDVDLYYAAEATGGYDDAIGDLTETALITAGGAWTLNQTKVFAAVVPNAQYLYLTSGEAVAGTYDAGQFLIELWGIK